MSKNLKMFKNDENNASLLKKKLIINKKNTQIKIYEILEMKKKKF